MKTGSRVTCGSTLASVFRKQRLGITVALLLTVFAARPVMAATGVQFTVNGTGIQTLTFNGQNYLGSPGNTGKTYVTNATFRTTGGALTNYGWTQSVGNSTRTSDNATYFQQVYSYSSSDQFTLKMVLSGAGTNTLQVDVYETNNASSDTLARTEAGYYLPLQLPGAATQFNASIPMELGAYDPNSQPAQLLSGTWGSVAIWQTP